MLVFRAGILNVGPDMAFSEASWSGSTVFQKWISPGSAGKGLNSTYFIWIIILLNMHISYGA